MREKLFLGKNVNKTYLSQYFFLVCKLVSTIVAVVGCIHLNS